MAAAAAGIECVEGGGVHVVVFQLPGAFEVCLPGQEWQGGDQHGGGDQSDVFFCWRLRALGLARCLRGPPAQVPVSFVRELRRHRREHRLEDVTALLRDAARALVAGRVQ